MKNHWYVDDITNWGCWVLELPKDIRQHEFEQLSVKMAEIIIESQLFIFEPLPEDIEHFDPDGYTEARRQILEDKGTLDILPRSKYSVKVSFYAHSEEIKSKYVADISRLLGEIEPHIRDTYLGRRAISAQLPPQFSYLAYYIAQELRWGII